MKLENLGVRAVRVTSNNVDLVEVIENGTYRFGEHYINACLHV